MTTPQLSPRNHEFRAVHPSSDALRRLQAVGGAPLVTVMMSTEPAARMRQIDKDRLDRLVTDAVLRVGRETGAARADRDRLIAELEAVRHAVGTGATGRGLAVFVGGGVTEAFRLPGPPEDRVVVDPTFATRDLAEAVWSQPNVRLLALAGDRARLFLDGPLPTREVNDDSFPMTAGDDADADRRGHRHQSDPRQQAKIRTERFLRDVDATLRGHHSSHLPLVVFATSAVIGRFNGLTRQALLGTIQGNRMATSGRELAGLAEPLIRSYLDRQRRVALEQFDDATSAWRTTCGVAATWAATNSDRVATLMVDRTFRWPGRPLHDGDAVAPAVDPTEPGVIDDVVDDLIERVALAGGEVHFLPGGALGLDGVAAVLRS